MLPIPTHTAFATFGGAMALVIMGTLLSSWPVATLGGALVCGLALALAMTMPLGRRVRRHRLEFAWWLSHAEPGSGGGAVVPGKPFDVRCFLRHRGGMNLSLRELRPLVPGGVRLLSEAPALPLAPNARSEFTFKLVAPAAGRVVLHGLAVTLPGPLGLFEVPLYFPNPLVIKVLPRAAARSRPRARPAPGQPVERSGTSLRSPMGGGTELRELRDLRPGDPFKSIAWKASARTGKLMVREVEQETQQTRYVICDVSGTMRGGDPGRRKLDFALEAAAAEAQRALMQGDRVGLLTVDGRLLAHVPAADSRPQLLRIFEALMLATEVVDEDLTEVDDDEVAAIVGRYVRQQDGLDFARAGGWDVPMLARHAKQALGDVRADPIRASSPTGELLRRFCRVRGLPLPYRPDPRDGAKSAGLAAALCEVGGRKRSPMSVVVLTDLDGLGDPEPLRAAIELLRLHGHAIAVVVPDGPSFADPPRTDLERDVFAVYARGERRRFEEARALFGPLGARVLSATAQDRPALVLARAQRVARAA